MHGWVQAILSFAAFGLLATNIPFSAHSASAPGLFTACLVSLIVAAGGNTSQRTL
jgi:hypothetical protein